MSRRQHYHTTLPLSRRYMQKPPLLCRVLVANNSASSASPYRHRLLPRLLPHSSAPRHGLTSSLYTLYTSDLPLLAVFFFFEPIRLSPEGSLRLWHSSIIPLSQRYATIPP